ncbi:MAG: putative mannose-6-phosphate isomerase GmuF [Smithella sp. PtaU1.Bin162]|nr:MAG: putative mannose-6-phosphate isomerase GmuF [Smithella sp. PtaU1.Bin162]
MKAYPVKLIPTYAERPWGGKLLKERLGKEIPNRKIGESWEISSHPHGLSRIANGPLAGKTIPELLSRYGAKFIGPKLSGKYGNTFPLLTKFIDVNSLASVQVHPDDIQADELENQQFGKAEVWFILALEKTAEIYIGFRRNAGKKEFLNALANGTVKELLNRVNVKPGDCIYVPPGTVHACGNGVFMLEIQQSSDLTYRVYDWDRTDAEGRKRELHMDKALKVINFNAQPEIFRANDKINNLSQILTSPYFDIYQVSVKNEFSLPVKKTCIAGTLLEGICDLISGNGVLHLVQGDSFLIPADAESEFISDKCKMIFTILR